MNPLLKQTEQHIGVKRKYKEEMGGVHGNASAFKYKTK